MTYGLCFGILDSKNYEFVSIGYISNINYNAGNIIIHTQENYRNKGYGKKIVYAICNECKKNNIIPIYWVESNNKSSVELAKNIGFNVRCKETVFAISNLNFYKKYNILK